MRNYLLAILMLSASSAMAQIQNSEVYEFGDVVLKSQVRNHICLPKVDGYTPLKCDFHIHTVFSDGEVWPTTRVDEAWSDGLDVIAITDHIEYRPYKDVVKGDLNESNKIAANHAKNKGILVVPGIEITRSKPLGHLNALFIKDANALDVDNELEAIDIAVSQGAYILWNHPGWPDDKTTLYPVHEQLIKDKKISAVEVFNDIEYYPRSFKWCNDYNLAYFACSDIHDLIVTHYGKNIRPMTIVFAKEKTKESLREAMDARRTIAFFNGQLAGDKDLLEKFVKASLEITKVGEDVVEVYNNSDITYPIRANGQTIRLKAGKTVRISKLAESYIVTNCHIGENEKLTISL
ncbi:MAG: PHP domain-containing protein [Rikenellaceae bacterium]